ncbi:hypothetical protein PR048_028709 [Dryococelus australis]|uniref:Uncharacterized protein n=1 Tax=Dryococelus australis TaxID=614101 RepID=A0ABQ9GF24_9NEOP|nr:hypothetical protein PR048_028709 [Dryococelus australis]
MGQVSIGRSHLAAAAKDIGEEDGRRQEIARRRRTRCLWCELTRERATRRVKATVLEGALRTLEHCVSTAQLHNLRNSSVFNRKPTLSEERKNSNKRKMIAPEIGVNAAARLRVEGGKANSVEADLQDRASRGDCCFVHDGIIQYRLFTVSMEQRRNERTGEMGYPRENPPTDGIVRHDSHMQKSGVTRPGIEPRSPCWEASRLTAQPPWPRGKNKCIGIRCTVPLAGWMSFVCMRRRNTLRLGLAALQAVNSHEWTSKLNNVCATIELSICHVGGTGARTRDHPTTSAVRINRAGTGKAFFAHITVKKFTQDFEQQRSVRNKQVTVLGPNEDKKSYPDPIAHLQIVAFEECHCRNQPVLSPEQCSNGERDLPPLHEHLPTSKADLLRARLSGAFSRVGVIRATLSRLFRSRFRVRFLTYPSIAERVLISLRPVLTTKTPPAVNAEQKAARATYKPPPGGSRIALIQLSRRAGGHAETHRPEDEQLAELLSHPQEPR